MAETSTSPAPHPEAVGAAFSPAALRAAQERAMAAVKAIGASIRPGMTEARALDVAAEVLAARGLDRIWHKTVVRLGAETLKTFRDLGDEDAVLGENDIFFVDIGPLFEGHEGDAGDSFVTGDDPEMAACAAAARTLWDDVAARWRQEKITGAALYAYAAQRAEAMGWRLNLAVRGHRVCDFPHAIYRAGALGDFGLCPTTGLWILEIQIAHPKRPFGAFYEDLLSDEGALVLGS